MYGQNVENQIVGGSSRRRSAEGSQATGWDDLPSHLRPHKDEKGRPLVLLRNLIPHLIRKAFREFRITHYNNNQPNFYTEKVGSVFVVNVRLIKIEIDRLSIIQTLNEHILRMFKDAVLSGIAKSALKRSLKHVEKN